jgi:hypothetical protein
VVDKFQHITETYALRYKIGNVLLPPLHAIVVIMFTYIFNKNITWNKGEYQSIQVSSLFMSEAFCVFIPELQ